MTEISAWMIAPAGQAKAVMCEAGTLMNGIEVAQRRGALRGSPGTILQDRIAGCSISHAHLDHVAGMLIASPDDKAKAIYARPGERRPARELFQRQGLA